MDDKTMLKELIKIRKALEGIDSVLKCAFMTQMAKKTEKREENENDSNQ